MFEYELAMQRDMKKNMNENKLFEMKKKILKEQSESFKSIEEHF